MRPHVSIRRFESTDQGTFGRLTILHTSLYTGELPWRENRPNNSCIPAGTYHTILSYSERFGRVLYMLSSVPSRSGIRIHSANLMGDKILGYKTQLNGCIALGEKLGWIDGQKALLVSRPAIRRMEEYFNGKSFTLEITDEFS